MRKDMSKIIVERPRVGHSRRYAKPGRSRVVTDDDGDPLDAREPTRRPARTKYLNENLAPLKRYLDAQVGRPWSKVYAEIATHLRPSSTVQQHVRDHLTDFVAISTRMVGGAVHVQPRYGGPVPLAEARCHFFVHPKSGLLKRNTLRPTSSWYRTQYRNRDSIASTPDRIVTSATQQIHRLNDGAWWAVTLAPVDAAAPAAPVDVVLRDGLSTRSPEQLYGRAGLYARHKRALSKAEKTRLGLA